MGHISCNLLKGEPNHDWVVSQKVPTAESREGCSSVHWQVNVAFQNHPNVCFLGYIGCGSDCLVGQGGDCLVM